MVQTRNQKRKSEDIENNDNDITEGVHITFKKRKITKEEEDDELKIKSKQLENKLNKSNYTDSESESYTESESESESELVADKNTIEYKIKKIITDLNVKHKNKEKKEIKENNVYDDFHELIQSVYEGDFFERVPLEDQKKLLKQKMTHDQIKELKDQLVIIHENYRNSSPSVIDILKMNISLQQKQKLLEGIHCLANSEVLTHEYNSNLKFLNTNISNKNNEDPTLLELEQRILKSTLNKTDSYRMKILKSNMSFENKVIAYKKLEIMETYEGTDTSEYAKYKSWMDSLLSIPFNTYNESGITTESPVDIIKNYITKVRDVLDEKLSFLEKPKDQIINLVTQMVRNPDININAIGLCGVAGTGKSQIVASIAKALDRPYRMISLGGESDSSSLTGHGFTYVGSMPGRLIDILIDSKTMNPIVLIDELDKVSETHHGKEIIGTLIHLTDSTTNNKYNLDKYFSGIEFNLSKVLFVFTYNDHTKIDKILADRLLKINVDSYTNKEKLEITSKHIIPYLLDKFKFKNSDIIFDEESIKYIIQNSKQNGGMRNIKTKLKIIISRINNLLLTNQQDNIIKLKYKKLYTYYKTLPVYVLNKHIEILLDESITDDSKNDCPPPGMYL